MSASPTRPPTAEGEVPDWFARLAAAAGPQVPVLTRSLPAVGALRRSAVLMLFGHAAHGPDVLLTERAANLRTHAGQVAFPGGRIEPQDGGPADAALREAEEEAGVAPQGVEVAGVFQEVHVPPSANAVTPVLAWWRRPNPVRVGDPVEVARALRVPLAELVEPANRFSSRHPSGYVGPAFEAGGLFVWGFTAAVLDRLLELSGWARPWDTGRVRDLPAPAVPPGGHRAGPGRAAGEPAGPPPGRRG